jgi:hypothetical protein
MKEIDNEKREKPKENFFRGLLDLSTGSRLI